MTKEKKHRFSDPLDQAIFSNRYTARHVHRCFPWIAGTTLFNRRAAGRYGRVPEKTGTGIAVEFSFAGLVWIGVDDELISLGARGDVSSIERYLIPPPYETPPVEPKLVSDTQEILDFFIAQSFSVGVTVDISHRRKNETEKGTNRNQRSERVFEVQIHDLDHPPSMGVDTHRVTGRGLTAFSSGKVSVFKIYQHVLDRLDLRTPSKLFEKTTG